jgi:hypothetical protein
MKKYHKINPFWTYSRSERIGIAILTTGILFNAVIKWKNTVLLEQNIQKLNAEILRPVVKKDTFPFQRIEEPVINKTEKTKVKSARKKTIKLNIALTSLNDLVKIGLDSAISLSIIENKYDYKSWNEICNSDSLCRALLKQKSLYYWVDQSKLKIALNEADTNQLRQLKGIGPVLSNRIIKYRNSLGGFVDKSQLKEVWGLNLETYQQIKQQVYIDNQPKKKTILQHSDLLINHPYMPYELRNKLSNYLELNPKDSLSVKTLKLPYINDSVINKLAYYFE